MTQAEEIKKLYAEIEALRQEVAALRADRSVHHYHHAPPWHETQHWPRYSPGSPMPRYPFGPQPMGISTTSGRSSGEIGNGHGDPQNWSSQVANG